MFGYRYEHCGASTSTVKPYIIHIRYENVENEKCVGVCVILYSISYM